MNTIKKRNVGIALLGLPLILTFGGASPTHGRAEFIVAVTIRARNRSYPSTPITVAIPAPPNGQSDLLATKRGGATYWVLRQTGAPFEYPCQITRGEGREILSFILPSLQKDETRTFRLVRSTSKAFSGHAVVTAHEGDNVEIKIDGQLFTRYTTKSGPNKPFFYPILTAHGQDLTRRWPMETGTGESSDHPHHRGLWFTHGSVNGIDFWSEQGIVGSTLNTGFEQLEAGPVFGSFRSHTDWLDPTGKHIATDMRHVRIWRLSAEDRILDFEIIVTPSDGPLVFGDTKEGMFGMRVRDDLAPSQHKGGHIVASTGKQDTAVWSTAADWVDYWGTVEGQTEGIAIFDNPSNVRHPETWHARDYGLFAVNPFGLHDFGKGPKGTGNYTVMPGQSLPFHYRVLFHAGDPQAGQVASQYEAYIDPPEAKAVWRR